LVIGFLVFFIKAARGDKIAHEIGDYATRTSSQIDRDLEAGIYVETVAELTVRRGRIDDAYAVEWSDQTTEVLDRDGTLGRLMLASPIRDVTVRYTPNARIIFDVTASDGRLLYRGVELDGR